MPSASSSETAKNLYVSHDLGRSGRSVAWFLGNNSIPGELGAFKSNFLPFAAGLDPD